MPRETVIASDAFDDDDRRRDAALRPKLAQGGHRPAARSSSGWQIAVNAAKKLKEPLGHILFDGPPGLGKTTFATVLPNELGTSIQMTSGPALSKPADLLPFLTNLEEGSILFIDEIHRMPRVVEEFIYPAMEDFRIDIVLGEGINARTISMHLKRFTLIGATTRSGMLSEPDARPVQDARAPGVLHASRSWPQIVRVNAAQAATRRSPTTPRSNWPAAAAARRGSPTPACTGSAATPTSEADGAITLDIARAALDMAEVDARGAGQAGPPLPGDADRRVRRRADRGRGDRGDDEPRRPTRCPTRSSRTCCASSSSSARRAAGWRRRGRSSCSARPRRSKAGRCSSEIDRVNSARLARPGDRP